MKYCSHKTSRWGGWAFVAGVLAVGIVQLFLRNEPTPTVPQQIHARLISWGLLLNNLAPPVSQDEIDQHIALLRSDISEARIQAANWLSKHGIRNSAAAIVAAMKDCSTSRPCQLAKSLGALGDDRFVPELVQATQHPSNMDLRVCATMALEQIQSPKTIDALISVYDRNAAATTAIKALGKIAHPSALPFLQRVATNPRNETERKLANQAMERLELMASFDPIPDLLDLLQKSMHPEQHGDRHAGQIDVWSARKLAELADPRTISVLENCLRNLPPTHIDNLVTLTACLIAHGDPGLDAIRRLIEEDNPTHHHVQLVLHAAITLNDHL